MKKSLFAVAALSAIAGAAQAQSSVTVYGILDMGYVGSNNTLNSSSYTSAGAPSATNSNGNVKVQNSAFAASAEQTSRLGFKGTEDLGGGKSAFFTAEFQLYPADQTLSGNSNTGLLNRQTFVGLKQNGVGQFALGTQYTPIHNAVGATDPGQQNNVAGNVIYAASTGPASSTNGDVGKSIAQTNGVAYTVRTANTLTASTDNIAGFKLNAMYTLNNQNATVVSSSSGGNTNANGWGLGLDYTWNKLFVTANTQQLRQVTTVTQNYNTSTGSGYGISGSGAAAIATGWNPWSQAGGAIVNGTSGTGYNTSGTQLAAPLNVQDNQTYVGATYDFGILKAYGSWISRKANDVSNSSYFLKRSAEQIGVRSYITPTIEGWASAGLGRYTAAGNNNPTMNFSAWQLGSNYWLSKRTNLYAIYGYSSTSTAAVATVSTAGTTSTATVSGNLSNYAIGVRHTF
ncbi:porin [Polynucleobacter sp. AP-Sanab-80-C2]|uniref:porin n=1 Tax=Polynucleobacter sp. AP-Sanab-80-C2 TaxID=3108274 RepID=UPI002B239A54|nr:porin [Polynucleobacter sp. AP-Sanab-80-C2]MEA9598759.1 porin [Polynucleobacter sp. AP-Sanab-80-C2]